MIVLIAMSNRNSRHSDLHLMVDFNRHRPLKKSEIWSGPEYEF
jgi:hypothetical protein